jgi:hypothetical protein
MSLGGRLAQLAAVAWTPRISLLYGALESDGGRANCIGPDGTYDVTYQNTALF